MIPFKIKTINRMLHEYMLRTLIFVNFIHETQELCGSWKMYKRLDDLSPTEISQANALFSWQKCKQFSEISR